MLPDGVKGDGELRPFADVVDPDDIPRVTRWSAGAIGADQRELLR